MNVKTPQLNKTKKPRLKPGITGVGFEFVNDGHAYYLDGVRLPGVTTILGMKAKPMLIQWAANQAVEYIKNNATLNPLEKNPFALTYIVSQEVLKEASVAHRKKKEDAGAKGTDVHGILEGIIKEAIEKDGGYITGHLVDEIPQVSHFIDWALNNHVKFLASEEKVFSRRLFVGGTIDFICEIDGEVWIGDIKTSSGIYSEHFFQTAAYQLLLEDMVEAGDGGMPVNFKGHVITCLKKDGTFEEKRSISNEDNKKGFLACFDLYKIEQKLQGNIL